MKKTFLVLTTKEEYGELFKEYKGQPITYGVDGVGIQAKNENVNIIFLKTLIGKVSAAYAATMGIQLFHPHHIIFAGVAGGLKKTKPGDVVCATRLRYFDADVTAFNYIMGQLPSMPEAFTALYPQNLKIKGVHIYEGEIVSGDSFVQSAKLLKYIHTHFPEALALDMESVAVAQVAYMSRIPFTCIRGISDNANHSASSDFEKNLITAIESTRLVLNKILVHYIQ